jgi:hypothetical protein
MAKKITTRLKKDAPANNSQLHTIIMTVIIMTALFAAGLILFQEFTSSNNLLKQSDASRTGVSQLEKQTSTPLFAQGQGATLTSDGYQQIRMTADGTGFTPRTFVLKTGVPVRWVIDGKELNGCNSAVKIPSLNVYQDLQEGEQTVIFTPNTSGTIPFSCGMGMLKGNFVVKDNIDLANNEVISAQLAAAPKPTGGSCGGSAGGCGCGR